MLNGCEPSPVGMALSIVSRVTDSQGLSRAEAAAAKRRRLTAAAAKVLHEKGVERTAIADIAQAAGVPVGQP